MDRLTDGQMCIYYADMQRWCRGGAEVVQRWCRGGAERCRCADVQRRERWCREVGRCVVGGGAEVVERAGAGDVQMYRGGRGGAEVERCVVGGAEVMQRGADAQVQRC